MSELFDKANEYALHPDIVVGARLPKRFADEGQQRLQSQAKLAVSEARLLTRYDRVNEDHPGFQAKTMSNLKKLEALIDNWDQQSDGRYAKTFANPEALEQALQFMTKVTYEYAKDYVEPSRDGLTLTMPAQNYDMVFNPTRYFANKSHREKLTVTNRLAGILDAGVAAPTNIDIGSPTRGAFALAYELVDRMYDPTVSTRRRELLGAEIQETLTTAAQASKILRDEEFSVSGHEKTDLQDADNDGKLYGAAHGLLIEAQARIEKREERYPPTDAEEGQDMARLMKAELDQLRREILEGWKPYKDGCVSKVFKGGDKGPDTLSFLMQMYAVASYGKPPVLEPDQLAREADVIKGKNTTGDMRMRVVVPAALLKAVQENEQQLGI